MLTRLRTDRDGFGLIELIMALTVLNIGILATVAALNSGAIAIQRASKVSTATAIADKEMELYRAIRYGAIALTGTTVAAADSDASYYGDPARQGGATMTTVSSCDPAVDATACEASRTLSGTQTPDNRPYRIDKYIFEQTPVASSRPLKIITVVVRDGSNLSKSLVRTQSTFDQSTGT